MKIETILFITIFVPPALIGAYCAFTIWRDFEGGMIEKEKRCQKCGLKFYNGHERDSSYECQCHLEEE